MFVWGWVTWVVRDRFDRDPVADRTALPDCHVIYIRCGNYGIVYVGPGTNHDASWGRDDIYVWTKRCRRSYSREIGGLKQHMPVLHAPSGLDDECCQPIKKKINYAFCQDQYIF